MDSRGGRQEVIRMTRVIYGDLRLTLLHITCALATAALLVALPAPADAANLLQEEKSPDGGRVHGGERQERVVVAPEPPHWSGWGAWRPGVHRSAPRIRLWVDRGEWSTYYPGDRLWVYFRVDRPCYVTVLDYTPDGRVETIFPSRWSGSSFVSPGVTYRIPESRRYSLRIAGPGGIETLVACAHETPWPSGPGGVWIPRHHPSRGRVVVGRPGGSPPPGWHGRVAVPPHKWPVPPAWRDRPERWSCESVSFYVGAGGHWHGAPWGRDLRPPYNHGGSWRDCPYGGGDSWHGGDDDWHGGSDGWHGGDWSGPRDQHRDDWRDEWGGTEVLYDRFLMKGCGDRFYRDVYVRGEKAVISIECLESEWGQPSEIVGRMFPDARGRDHIIFRLDMRGEHGQRPWEGQVFYGELGGLAVRVRISDLEIDRSEPGRGPRLDSIRFEIQAHAR
jgi:hypothetical protein